VFTMKMAHWIGLTGLAFLLALGEVFMPRHLGFQDLNEAAAKARASGYFVTSDRADGVIENGFVVSPYPIHYTDANLLLKIGKMGPEWKDKVWVTRTSCNCCLEGVIPDDAAVQSWGNVIAIGDSKLLVRLQAKFRYSCVSKRGKSGDLRLADSPNLTKHLLQINPFSIESRPSNDHLNLPWC
jgi:hypothetical protein